MLRAKVHADMKRGHTQQDQLSEGQTKRACLGPNKPSSDNPCDPKSAFPNPGFKQQCLLPVRPPYYKIKYFKDSSLTWSDVWLKQAYEQDEERDCDGSNFERNTGDESSVTSSKSWTLAAAHDLSSRYEQMMYRLKFFVSPGHTLDRNVQCLQRLLISEDVFLTMDKSIDVIIHRFCQVTDSIFEELGMTDFDGKSFDMRPSYSEHQGHFVSFSVLSPCVKLMHARWHTKLGKDRRFVREMLERAASVLLGLAEAHNDLSRLWSKTHDGKSCRNFCRAGHFDGPPDRERPWYASKHRVNQVLQNTPCMSDIECSYCHLDRILHQLEFELPRAYSFMERWAMNPSLPPGMEQARKLRLELDDVSLSNLEAVAPIVARYQLIMVPSRVKKNFWRNPMPDCSNLCIANCPWNFHRCKEFAARLTKLEHQTNSLESKLDLEIRSFTIWKEHEFASVPIYSDQLPHFVRFAEAPTGVWDLSQVMQMAHRKNGERILIGRFNHHLKMLGKFQKMAKKDCDRLMKLCHDGKSCRYYPERQPNMILDRHYPFYLQMEDPTLDDPDILSTFFPHDGECPYCWLDRMCLQVEQDMKLLLKYLKQWRERPEVTMGLPWGGGLCL